MKRYCSIIMALLMILQCTGTVYGKENGNWLYSVEFMVRDAEGEESHVCNLKDLKGHEGKYILTACAKDYYLNEISPEDVECEWMLTEYDEKNETFGEKGIEWKGITLEDTGVVNGRNTAVMTISPDANAGTFAVRVHYTRARGSSLSNYSQHSNAYRSFWIYENGMIQEEPRLYGVRMECQETAYDHENSCWSIVSDREKETHLTIKAYAVDQDREYFTGKGSTDFHWGLTDGFHNAKRSSIRTKLNDITITASKADPTIAIVTIPPETETEVWVYAGLDRGKDFIKYPYLLKITLPEKKQKEPETISVYGALEAADALYALGLFSGTGIDEKGEPVYDLDKALTRQEAMAMLVRLLGKSEEAQAGVWTTPFTDVSNWAKPYVGYAYANGLASGTSATTFGGNENVTSAQYITFVLRAMGYESGVDFKWNASWELSDQLNITNGQYSLDSAFDRGDVAEISLRALGAKMKQNEEIMADYLVQLGTLEKEKYDNVLQR